MGLVRQMILNMSTASQDCIPERLWNKRGAGAEAEPP